MRLGISLAITQPKAAGGEVIELLASIDIADAGNIDSFTRAGAAGFTSASAANIWQREAATDVLRDAHYPGGGAVRCVILEDSPTPCALVAPENIVVTPNDLDFTFEFDAIPDVTSRLRYEWRLDDTGSWTSLGTSTSGSGTSTEGDHILNVRAVSTSGVAGETGDSALFSLIAPIEEGFEEHFEDPSVGYDNSGWAEGGTVDPKSTTVVLSGTQSCKFTNGGYIYRIYSGSTVSVQFKTRGAAPTDVLPSLKIFNGSDAIVASFLSVSGKLYAYNGATELAEAGTSAPAANTVYWYRLTYEKATIAGNDGKTKLYVSTNGTDWTLLVSITNGVATTDVAYIAFSAQLVAGNAAIGYVDDIFINNGFDDWPA